MMGYNSGFNSSSTDNIDIATKQQHLINGLNELLTMMLSREDILTTPIFRPLGMPRGDDTRKVSNSIERGFKLTDILTNNSIQEENKITLDSTSTPSFAADFCGTLLKELFSKLVLEGIRFLNEDTQYQFLSNLTTKQFNPDPQINEICWNLFRLLKKFVDNNTYTANKLAEILSPFIFSSYDYQHRITNLVTDLINAPCFNALPAVTSDCSSSARILQSLNVPIPVQEDDQPNFLMTSSIQPQSFGMKHLAKIIMMPLLALVATALTVTLLIFFPPGGIALTTGILIAAGAAAGAGGLGAGLGFGVAIDKVRSGKDKEEQTYQAPFEGNKCFPIYPQPVKTTKDLGVDSKNSLDGNDDSTGFKFK